MSVHSQPNELLLEVFTYLPTIRRDEQGRMGSNGLTSVLRVSKASERVPKARSGLTKQLWHKIAASFGNRLVVGVCDDPESRYARPGCFPAARDLHMFPTLVSGLQTLTRDADKFAQLVSRNVEALLTAAPNLKRVHIHHGGAHVSTAVTLTAQQTDTGDAPTNDGADVQKPVTSLICWPIAAASIVHSIAQRMEMDLSLHATYMRHWHERADSGFVSSSTPTTMWAQDATCAVKLLAAHTASYTSSASTNGVARPVIHILSNHTKVMQDTEDVPVRQDAIRLIDTVQRCVEPQASWENGGFTSEEVRDWVPDTKTPHVHIVLHPHKSVLTRIDAVQASLTLEGVDQDQVFKTANRYRKLVEAKGRRMKLCVETTVEDLDLNQETLFPFVPCFSSQTTGHDSVDRSMPIE